MRTTTQLRNLLNQPDIIVAPGTYDALSARIVSQAGAKAIYVSGAAVSAALLGQPDLGFLSLGELLDQIRRISYAADVPIVADADTGFGNAINIRRTIREYERAGAAAMHVEDQVFPKRCGHFEGKEVIPASEMVQKIQSAVDARTDSDFIIIARTDARAVEGLDAAIYRANLYAEAGADMIFFEAPCSVEEMRTVRAQVNVPLLANMVEGGKTPLRTAAELQEIGYQLVILPGTLQRVAAKAMQDAIASINEQGTSLPIIDKVLSFEGRNEITGLQYYYDLEKELAANTTAS